MENREIAKACGILEGTVRQRIARDMWGDDEHSNWVGDLVSIVSFDSESGLFKAEESWIEQ